MRIIAGQYRGRVLKSPPSMQIRPTSDRLRETLFNVLAPRLADARFLDLCAGSGACGIEALSRGAAFATFVDRSRKTCGLIEANLDLLGVPEERTEVVMSEVADYLRPVNVQARFVSVLTGVPQTRSFHIRPRGDSKVLRPLYHAVVEFAQPFGCGSHRRMLDAQPAQSAP